MFANLKNKIKEEIGGDVSTLVRNAGPGRNLNKHLSQAGSASSISSSQISLDETIREENNVSPSYRLRRENSFDLKLGDGTPLSTKDIKKLESREDEWRKRLQKKETELLKKMEKKDEEYRIKMMEREKEWKKIVEKHEKEKLKLVEDMQKAENARNALEVALNNAEEYKKKLYSFQEDAEQMEGLQNQEMARIKHLLLAKEQEVDDKSQRLKTALTEVDNLKMELSRLRRYEDELNNVQDQSTQEIDGQKYLLEEASKNLIKKETELTKAKSAFEEEKSKNLLLQLEVDRLRDELESEKAVNTNINITLEKERTEKDSALLRTAKMSQEIQIAKQETLTQEEENTELQSRLDDLENVLKSKCKDLADITKKLDDAVQKIQDFEQFKFDTEKLEGNEKVLKTSLLDLEEQLNEKNKTIKVLQQRLADMKKTLQRELRVPSSTLDSEAESAAAILNPSSSKTVTAKQNSSREDDVNFAYLKHVLIKFLTSREYEALHLTRAVATLLHFSPEEEKLLQETLEWKMSWFGTKPNLGIGQTAKAIPPS